MCKQFFLFSTACVTGSVWYRNLISITVTSILRWVCHGNLLSHRVSAGIPLHSTPLGLVQELLCTLLPTIIIPLGDSLLRRLNTA